MPAPWPVPALLHDKTTAPSTRSFPRATTKLTPNTPTTTGSIRRACAVKLEHEQEAAMPNTSRHNHSTLAAVLMLAGLFGTQTASAQQGPPAVPVSVAAPIAKRVTQWDEYSGRFQAVETVEVRPRVSGFIEKVHFKDGQIVKAGDLLFTLEQRAFEISVESAEAELTRTTAQVDLQDAEVERVTPLAKTGAATKRELDTRQANLAIAQAQRQAAQAGLKVAKLNLEWTEVRAPIAGRISDRKVDVGNLVTGGAAGATLLANIVSLDPIYFRFEVSESDYIRYVRGFISGARESGRQVAHPVRLKLADEKVFAREGKLDFVDNQLNPRSGTMRGRAVVDNADQLFTPGLFARMQLYGGDIDALLVSDKAIVSDQARKIVFTVGADDVVKAQPVELGPIVDGLRVIRSGLKADDRVVVDGLANPMVRPGSKVVPQTVELTTKLN